MGKEKKDKMKVKQKEDLKDFLQATATIRKEAKKEQEKKPDATKDDKSENKRRLSINSEVDDSEPKTKIPKLNDFETEIKKVKTDAMKPMGRIPKLEKKEEKRERTDSVKVWMESKRSTNLSLNLIHAPSQSTTTGIDTDQVKNTRRGIEKNTRRRRKKRTKIRRKKTSQRKLNPSLVHTQLMKTNITRR